MNDSPDYRYCPYDGELLRRGDLANLEHARPRCAQCGFVDYQNPKPCVGILILNGRNLLLARRAVEPAKGQWDIPGGFIDVGESAAQAVVREALEETSLHVRVIECLGSLPDIYGDRREPTINFCYLAEVIAGEIRPQSDVAELHWVSLDCLPVKMAFDHQYEMLRWAQTTIQRKAT